jgi:hypothetical protein
MKELNVKLNRRSESESTDIVQIKIDELCFRVTAEIDGGVRINKVDQSIHGKHGMKITPASGNEIVIK